MYNESEEKIIEFIIKNQRKRKVAAFKRRSFKNVDRLSNQPSYVNTTIAVHKSKLALLGL